MLLIPSREHNLRNHDVSSSNFNNGTEESLNFNMNITVEDRGNMTFEDFTY